MTVLSAYLRYIIERVIIARCDMDIFSDDESDEEMLEDALSREWPFNFAGVEYEDVSYWYPFPE